MELNVAKLRSLGIPEDLIEDATKPESGVLKEKRRKLYINQTRRTNALFRILCLLDRSKPTPEATRAVEFHMAEIAARVERRYGQLQAEKRTAFGVPSQPAQRGRKSAREKQTQEARQGRSAQKERAGKAAGLARGGAKGANPLTK